MAALTPAQVSEFLKLASALSPENLHWDGERSRSAARNAERDLKRKWRMLERDLGRPVDESEVWAAHAEHLINRPRSAGFLKKTFSV